jgi:hypothetical protein
MLTTWNSACGIAEYSKNLVDQFLCTKEAHNILLLTNKDDLSIHAHPRAKVAKIFGVHWWGENPAIDTKKLAKEWYYFEKEHGKIDVLCVQYQSSLYEHTGFNWILANVKCPVVVMFHDSSRNPRHVFPDNMVSLSHNKNIESNYYIPFPTIDTIPLVFSFGMGRNDYDFIEKTCTEIGVSFRGHDSRKSGWLNEHDLFTSMKEADAIVLWYNDVPIEGQSAALRTAISSHRPVIVNDVGWFSNAPGFVRKATNKNTLQIALDEVLHLNYIRDNSFEKCANKYLEIFNDSK